MESQMDKRMEHGRETAGYVYVCVYICTHIHIHMHIRVMLYRVVRELDTKLPL